MIECKQKGKTHKTQMYLKAIWKFKVRVLSFLKCEETVDIGVVKLYMPRLRYSVMGSEMWIVIVLEFIDILRVIARVVAF